MKCGVQVDCAATLDGVEVLAGHVPPPERVGETVRGRNRILDGEVDPHTPDRRHGVRGVADAQHAGPPPALQAVDRDGQELDVLPAADLGDPVAQERRGRRDTLAQGVEASGLRGLEAALRDHERALEVVAAVEHHEHLARVEPNGQLGRIVRAARDAHPEHVHRRTEVLDLEAGPRSHGGMAPVRPDDELGAHLERSVGRAGLHSNDAVAFGQEVRDLRLQTKPEAAVALRLLREEIEEVPLRHQSDEPAVVGRWEKSAVVTGSSPNCAVMCVAF